ncbi:MAG: phosphoribulokinase [Mariprofundales bacterium]
MSYKHPVVAITGSSGAGTSTAKTAFEHIFRRLKINPAIIEGDSFHKFDRASFKVAAAKHEAEGRRLSHFSPDANELKKLESLFNEYRQKGSGKKRYYLHNDVEAAPYNKQAGTFTDWENIESGSDLLFYEGLHGGYAAEDSSVDVARLVDLLIGIVPVVNLEWIQKIKRDTDMRGYSSEAVVDTILQRMHDYVHHITPQFSRTHINFQRVPLVDTSNPFIARDIPTLDESVIVIRVNHPERWKCIDFTYLLAIINGSFMSRKNTLVIPAGKMTMAMELILEPIVENLLKIKDKQ